MSFWENHSNGRRDREGTLLFKLRALDYAPIPKKIYIVFSGCQRCATYEFSGKTPPMIKEIMPSRYIALTASVV